MKVAKLVYFSLMTRVIVDENATEEEIIKACYPNIQAKLDNSELGENLEEIDDDEEMPFGSYEERQCPVCNRENTREDLDNPDTMRSCEDCGCDYRWEDREILLDPRDELSPEEIKSRGYNPL